MSNRGRQALLGLFVFGCCGWTINVEPGRVTVDSIVSTRPITHIGPTDAQGPGPWRQITITLSKVGIRSVFRWDSTFRFRVEDCNDQLIDYEDIYVKGEPIEKCVADSRFLEDLIQEPGNTVDANVLLEEEMFSQRSTICGKLVGGSMLGGEIKQYELKIK